MRRGAHLAPPDVTAARRLVGLFAGLAALVILPAAGDQVDATGPGVVAHASVVEVQPPANAVVATAPDEVVVTFTESVSLSGGSTQVFDDGGEELAVDASVVGDTLRIGLPARLDDGTYLVAWRVVSADSHPVTGTSTFSIGAPSATTAVAFDAGDDVPASVRAWRLLATAVAYAGVLVAVGTAWFSTRWHHDLDGEASTRTAVARVDQVTTVGCALGLVGLIAALPARLVVLGGQWAALSDGDFVADALTGPIGQATALSAVGLIALWWWHRRGIGSPAGTRAAGVPVGLGCSLLIFGGFALEGHTRTKDPAWLMTTSDLVHMAAASVWLGGVVALAVTLPRSSGVARSRMVSDVSTAALCAVVAVSAAGIAMSVMVLPSFNALADTGYGLALMVKIALVIALVAIGVRNRLVLVPVVAQSAGHAAATDGHGDIDASVRGLRTSTVAEVAIFIAVLLATATLVGRPPVIGPDRPGESTSSAASITADVPLSSGIGSVDVLIEPGRAGSNVVEVELVDVAGEPLAVVEPPEVELREPSRGIGPLTFGSTNGGDGRYRVDVDIPFAGTWELTVRARTSTFDVDEATTSFDVAE